MTGDTGSGRRAKIVCTLGPATSTPDQVAGLVAAGMDVARLNMSHGSQDGHLAVYQRVRAVSDASGHSVGVLADLQGPKIRLGTFQAGPVRLSPGQEFTISVRPVPGDEHEVSTTYPDLAGDVRAGDTVLVDDGRVVLEVQAVRDGRIRTRVIMEETGVRLPLIAKIEKPQAPDTLDEIVAAFDGIMVARGDLGVELPLEQVPMAQKRIITQARDQAKPVIVATQMLESMISAPRPTRAEASDVANAVLDGADALMLSAETSVGDYPAGAVATMARIITAAERDYLHPAASLAPGPASTVPASTGPASTGPASTGGAMARAAAEVGAVAGARALVAFTITGETSRRLARYRSPIPLLAFTPQPATRSQLALTWGVETFIVPPARHTDEMVRQVEEALLHIGRCEKGDKVVIVAGSPPGTPGRTNALRVHTIGGAAALGAGLA